ncbi:MAG: hypothetical protein KAH57_08560 [Thermoplasmata archaeon]|nr:hypothetical protein [Thermoplasmata archaeon]
MFCIIRCPKCENIQGSRYPIKKSVCIKCGTTIDVDKIIGMKLFDSHKDLLTMIQALKMKKDCIKPDPPALPVYRNKRKKIINRSDIRELILRETIDLKSIKDLYKVVKNSGIEESIFELELNRLVSTGDIFKPKEGFFKRVDA